MVGTRATEGQPMIDAFAHILSAPVIAHVADHNPALLASPNVAGRPALTDLGARLDLMHRYPGYRQVLTLAVPPLVEIADGAGARALCRASNDSLAALVAAHPEEFVGFAAEVVLPDMDFSFAEAERAITELGALGVQIYTNAAGRPLDDPDVFAIFAKMAELDRPVWIHPWRSPAMPDYATETASRFYLWQKFGWPFETTIAMARLVYAGLFRRFPELRVLTHHAGGVVPHLAGRLVLHHEDEAMRRSAGVPEDFTPDEVLGAYRSFYGDTVFSGAHHPLDCALAFFGADHLLFATDMPFGAEGGELFVRETIAAVAAHGDLAPALFAANAERILGVAAGGT